MPTNFSLCSCITEKTWNASSMARGRQMHPIAFCLIPPISITVLLMWNIAVSNSNPSQWFMRYIAHLITVKYWEC